MSTFSQKIGYDIKSFLEKCLKLVQTQHQNLISYYVADGPFPKDAFDLLDSLVQESQEIYSRIILNRQTFDKYTDFMVFDQVEDFVSVFNTFLNYSRWLKSSTIKGRFKSTTEINYVLRQNQTLESLSRELGYEDSEKGFLDLSLRNQIKETDYTLNGGLVFKFSYQGDNVLKLQTVVDEMTGDNLFGKDVCKKIQLIEEDLLYLKPNDTFIQTCEILTSLLKNSNPEFPEDGFDKSAISNQNVLRCRMSTFIRQMYSVVGKDDTIASFSVGNVETEGDSLKIEVQYQSQLGTNVKNSVYGN